MLSSLYAPEATVLLAKTRQIKHAHIFEILHSILLIVSFYFHVFNLSETCTNCFYLSFLELI